MSIGELVVVVVVVQCGMTLAMQRRWRRMESDATVADALVSSIYQADFMSDQASSGTAFGVWRADLAEVEVRAS